MTSLFDNELISVRSVPCISWRAEIVNQLNERRVKEVKPFEEVINFFCKLLENVDLLRNENVELAIQKLKLRDELLNENAFQNNNNPLNTHNNNSNNAFNDNSSQGVIDYRRSGDSLNENKALLEKCTLYEKKIFSLQEELTDLHKKKGEDVHNILKLNNLLEEKEKEIKKLRSKISDCEDSLQAAKSARQAMEQKIIEVESDNQRIKDEYQALQITLSCFEKKHLALEKEHSDLVARWIARTAKDAEFFNTENEKIFRKNQEILKKELEEATKEIIDDSNIPTVSKPDRLSFNVGLPKTALYHFDAHEGEVNAIKWTSSGDVLATGGGDRKVKLWEISPNTSLLKGTLTGSNAAITSIDMNGDLILASSNDFASRVWTLSDLKLRRTLTGHSNKVLAVKFMIQNKICSGSHDRTLKIWDLNKNACIKTIFAGSSCNDLVTIEGQDSSIISGHFDKKIRFWDIRNSDATANDIILQGKITCLAISPDGFYLLTCVRDDTLKLLDLRMGQVVRAFYSDGFKVGVDYSRCTFSPDGQYVVAGSGEGSVFIWNTNKGCLEKILKNQHNTTVISCSWHPKGNYLLSCDRNKNVVVWE